MLYCICGYCLLTSQTWFRSRRLRRSLGDRGGKWLDGRGDSELSLMLLLQWSMDDSGQLHGDAVDALTLHSCKREILHL